MKSLGNAVWHRSRFSWQNTRGWNCLFAPFAESMRRIPNIMMMVTWEKRPGRKKDISPSSKESKKNYEGEERQRHVLYLSISCQSGFQKICKTAKKGCNNIHAHFRAQFHQHSTYSFYACRSRKCKKLQLSHKYLFTLLGFTGAKAERKMLMKLTPGVDAT